MVMPAACTFATTSLAVSVTTSSTQFTAATNTKTGGSVTALQGDTFAIGFFQTDGAANIKSTVTVRCL